jgi:hypothetical protein
MNKKLIISTIVIIISLLFSTATPAYAASNTYLQKANEFFSAYCLKQIRSVVPVMAVSCYVVEKVREHDSQMSVLSSKIATLEQNASQNQNNTWLSDIHFMDTFSGTQIDTNKWEVITDQDAPYTYNDQIVLTSQTNLFPFFQTKTNPFPTIGYRAEIIFEFKGSTNEQIAIAASEGKQTRSNPFSTPEDLEKRSFWLMAEGGNFKIGMGSSPSEVIPADQKRHTLVFERMGGPNNTFASEQRIYLDGKPIIWDVFNRSAPTNLWFGFVGTENPNIALKYLYIHSIKVIKQ